MQEDPSSQAYLTDKQIAADPEFQNVVSASTLQKKRVYGNGPRYVKVGSKCLYRRDWMREWLASLAVQSTSDKVA